MSLDSNNCNDGVEALVFSKMNSVGLDFNDYPALNLALHTSENAIQEARTVLKADDSNLYSQKDCVVFGSIARREATRCSDLDFLLVGDDIPADAESITQAIYAELSAKLIRDTKLREPGSSKLFGVYIKNSDLVQHIGLQGDTNTNLTRRVLLLEESVSLANSAYHRRLLEEIVEAYLSLRSPGSTAFPRVLINDIVRYWRTVAVDYHAKSRPSSRYSLRYLKLLFSRKFCYFSALAPLILMERKSVLGNVDKEIDFLVEHFLKPPIVRTLDLFEFIITEEAHPEEAQKHFMEVFESMNLFIEKSGNQEWRQMIANECKPNDCAYSQMPEFRFMRDNARRFHSALTSIMVSKTMFPFTREYVLL